MKWLRYTFVLAGLTVFAASSFAVLDSVAVAVANPTLSKEIVRYFPFYALGAICTACWQPSLFAASWILLWSLRGNNPKVTKIDPMAVFACLGVAAFAHQRLTEYDPFKGYLPFILGIVVWAIALIALYVVAVRFRDRSLSMLAGAVAMIGAGIVAYLNYKIYPGLYPSLHETLVNIAWASFFIGTAVTLWRVAYRRRWVVIVLLGSGAAVFLGGQGAPVSAPMRFRHFSAIGRVLSAEPMQVSHVDEKIDADPNAIGRFVAATGLPELSPDFSVDDYSILLVVVDATRFDGTSLPGGNGVTPNLTRRAKRGFVATRAYAPSSGTLHSMSAMFAMKLPSSLDLATWMKPWNGELAKTEVTVAEILEGIGYETWWVGHNHHEAFSLGILGLDQGFSKVDFVAEYADPPAVRTDQRIADRAIHRLEPYAQNPDKRFFGWIFFVAPHGPYVPHGYADMANKTNHDRYLQEIRYTDEQFERIFAYLESSQLLERTIVVFCSDHGEEFRDHGGIRHKSTVYSESIRVPFALWIPGLTGASDRPTSTLYLFPYLLLTTRDAAIRSQTEGHLRRYWGPLLRDTDGAVVSELLGHDRSLATIITRSYKLNRDFRSGLFQLFRLETDPTEQHDIFDNKAYLAAQAGMLKRFRAYHRIRRVFYRHRFLPEKKTPPIRRKVQLPQKHGRRFGRHAQRSTCL